MCFEKSPCSFGSEISRLLVRRTHDQNQSQAGSWGGGMRNPCRWPQEQHHQQPHSPVHILQFLEGKGPACSLRFTPRTRVHWRTHRQLRQALSCWCATPTLLGPSLVCLAPHSALCSNHVCESQRSPLRKALLALLFIDPKWRQDEGPYSSWGAGSWQWPPKAYMAVVSEEIMDTDL